MVIQFFNPVMVAHTMCHQLCSLGLGKMENTPTMLRTHTHHRCIINFGIL